jgi:flagellar hook-basal body complex protein FliE
MTMQTVGFKAYTEAMKQFSGAESRLKNTMPGSDKAPQKDFSEVLSESLEKVNQLQSDRSARVTAFASGENQNVHELMISLQKAGVAMNMTAAVRNKVMEAYKELTRLQF